MSKTAKKGDWKGRLTAWVDGDREPKDRTLFVMETRARRSRLPTVEEHEKREKHRLREFFNWYPAAAVLICLLLTAVLMFTVLQMPGFGRADNPLHNQVSEHYIEHGKEDSGAANVVTAMILTYRGFDTLGESCVLFLAVTSVMMLLLRDEKNTDGRDLRRMAQEDAIQREHQDVILKEAGEILIPFIFLFAIYVLLNGETSPGGGFSGGTILGSGLVMFACAFGFDKLRVFMNHRTYSVVRTFGLMLYAVLYGINIFLGANGLPNYLVGMSLLIDLAVGLVVACTVYGFYALFARGEPVSYTHLTLPTIAVLLFGIGFMNLLLQQNLLKKVVGFNIMDSAVFMLLASLGYIEGRVAPVMGEGVTPDASLFINPIPSGLVLTGIVVSVSITAFSLALIQRIHKHYGTIEMKELLERAKKEDD